MQEGSCYLQEGQCKFGMAPYKGNLRTEETYSNQGLSPNLLHLILGNYLSLWFFPHLLSVRLNGRSITKIQWECRQSTGHYDWQRPQKHLVGDSYSVVRGETPRNAQAYSLLCTQRSLLIMLRGSYGMLGIKPDQMHARKTPYLLYNHSSP